MSRRHSRQPSRERQAAGIRAVAASGGTATAIEVSAHDAVTSVLRESSSSLPAGASSKAMALSQPRDGLRIGSVPYLNARPLTCCLDAPSLVLDPPAKLADDLREGRLDAALVPIVEALDVEDYEVVDGFGICCHGPVHSVILAHRKPLRDLQTVALDPASRTSSHLAQILLKEYLKKVIIYVDDPAEADAFLLIGDPALVFRQEHPATPVLDLGAIWHAWTRLPFVFAVWTLRPHPQNQAVADTLRTAARLGMAERPRLAANDFEYKYLTSHIRYGIGPEEKSGIARFARELVKFGALDEAPELKWV